MDSDYETFIRARESEAAELERRAAAIRAVTAQLRQLASGGLPTPIGPSSEAPQETPDAPSSPADVPSLAGLTLAEAARRVLADEGGPLHVNEIVDRLRSRGFALPPGKDRGRRNVVGAMARRKDLFRLLGKGRYTFVAAGGARSGARPSGTQRNGAAPRGSVTAVVLDTVAREPGLTSTQVAERIAADLQTTSTNPRKLVLTTISILVGRRIRKAPDGGLHLMEQDDGQPASAAENDNGRMPELALDR